MVGAIDPHGRKATAELLEGLDRVPPLKVTIQGVEREELDAEAVIARMPQLALIDELQHSNPPGTPRQTRWEDVEAILEAGINVLTTMDVHHLESLNDQVQEITGVQIKDTVPDRLFQTASEVEMVDVTPRALIHRLDRGDVYPGAAATEELLKMYREGSLSALRELALREIAERVDVDVLEYRRENKIVKPWASRDNVMICISPTQRSLRLLRRGWRISSKLHGNVVAVTVQEDVPDAKQIKILDEDFKLAERLGIPIIKLQGDVAEELIRYAKENNVTQLVIGHSTRSRMKELIRPSIVNTLVRELSMVDILIVANERPTPNKD